MLNNECRPCIGFAHILGGRIAQAVLFKGFPGRQAQTECDRAPTFRHWGRQ
jgi:hypothetical protein